MHGAAHPDLKFQVLDVSYNKLHQLGKLNLPSLEVLNVSGNLLSDFDALLDDSMLLPSLYDLGCADNPFDPLEVWLGDVTKAKDNRECISLEWSGVLGSKIYDEYKLVFYTFVHAYAAIEKPLFSQFPFFYPFYIFRDTTMSMFLLRPVRCRTLRCLIKRCVL